MGDQEQLLKSAAWYREFADRAGNPMIWGCRLQMAEDLESEACRFTSCDHCTGSIRALPYGAGVTILGEWECHRTNNNSRN